MLIPVRLTYSITRFFWYFSVIVQTVQDVRLGCDSVFSHTEQFTMQ